MEEPHYVYPVLNEKGRLRGQVYRDDIIRLHQEDPLAPLEDVIQNDHLRIPSDLEGLEAFEMMNRDRASRNLRLMVVEPWDRELLVGVVTRMDILQAMEELDERHR
jgi:predicted transcriptional regulator